MGESSAGVDSLKSRALHLKFLEPLHMAIDAGFPTVVQVLLGCDADPNSRYPGGNAFRSNHTNLHVAMGKHMGLERLDMVDILLKKGAEVNAKDKLGRTPLHLLLEESHYRSDESSIVTLLLNVGADPNTKNIYGRTPLHPVLIRGNDETDGTGTVELMLKRGAKLEARDNKGHTPLSWTTHQCAKYYNGMACGAIRNLVKEGANLEAADNEGRTPLHISAGCYWAVGVHVFLKAGADTNARDKMGQSPMDLARTAQKQFIDRGFEFDFRDKFIEFEFATREFEEKEAKLKETIALLENASQGT